MSDLNFRIVFVPQEVNAHERDEFLIQVKDAVSSCGLENVCINYSQIKKSDDDDYPEIEELSIQVQAMPGPFYRGSKISQYKAFCLRWTNHIRELPYSYIVLCGNDCFCYPENSYYRESYQRFCFGVLPHNGLFYEYTSLTPPIYNSLVKFYHDTRNVVVKYECLELTFSYENIRGVFVNIDSPCEVFLDLFNPPLIFRKVLVTHREIKRRNLNMTGSLTEAEDFNIEEFNNEMDTFNVPPPINVDVIGRSNVLSFRFANLNRVEQIIAGIHFYCSEKSVHYSSISSLSKVKPPDPVIEQMHFGCAYLLTAIFKRNFIAVAQAHDDIHHYLNEMLFFSTESKDSLEKALIAVLSALDSGKILNFWQAIEAQYNFYVSNKDEMNFKNYIMPSNCCMIRRVILTPTRFLLYPSEIMCRNRVLRKFDSEYSLRVSFRDDNMSKLSFIAIFADQGVLEACIESPMTNGMLIGSRHYDFLAWSTSQIRDHGVWMYANDSKGITASHIREWMGDFSHIHNVPKYMARMGQSFSQTEDTFSVPLDPQHVRTQMDIEGGFDSVNGKPYCFSDGVGKISTELTAKVHNALGHDKLCSAFQIRYGGYKGMLVTDPTLRDTEIVFRESMKKFDSPQNTRLEIARTSAPVPLQLNRPFIALLNDLGVRHRTFLRLQEEMLKTLTDMLYNEDIAAEFLKSKTPTDMLDYEDLSRSGIYLTTEPFFKSILLALHRHRIENIKSKANVAIDPSKGRNLLGVMDETGILDYGQVFVQYTTDILCGATSRDTTILTEEVLVTKNPCMHPGDVRKFQAVDVPQLHHIVDCIVFPQRGPRPHPNEMAGSDLDGDEYAVLWFPDLIFHDTNQEASDFPEVHTEDVPSVTVAHMIEFLQMYIKNDQVGVIANAHLAHADNDGILSEVCRSIAKKFSVAVDFAKNGETTKLGRGENAGCCPDFMEKFHCYTYKSRKALGKMYRVCKDFESENQETSITYQNVKVDPDLVYDGWEKYKDDAVKSRNKYNALFRSVLRTYGIEHEAEALSGAFTNLHCRFHERRDRHEIEKVIIGCIKKLHKSMLEEFLEEFLGYADIDTTDKMMLQKASAWYIVTYSNPNAKFLSFPWTVSNYLTNIKVRRTLANPQPFSPAIMCLDEKILECKSKNVLPYFFETEIWYDYSFLCDPLIVICSLRTLILWAQDEDIIKTPGRDHQGFLYVDVFIRLFLHVADMLGYVIHRFSQRNNNRTSYSPGELCLEFLKFCSSFRFYNPYEMMEILPFTVYKYSKLAKRAVVSYHRFALSGIFQNLYFDSKIGKELIQMKSIYIDSKLFSPIPIKHDHLKKAEAALIKHSKVNHLTLREIVQTKKVCVSARGSDDALRELKSVLRMKHVTLRHLFSFGVMPENTGRDCSQHT